MLCLNIADFFSSEHFLSRAKANHHRFSFFLSYAASSINILSSEQKSFSSQRQRERAQWVRTLCLCGKKLKNEISSSGPKMALCKSRLHSFDVWLSFFFYPHPNL